MENSTPADKPERRRFPKVERNYPRSIVARPRGEVDYPLRKASLWILPWGRYDYPGIGRGLEELTGIKRGTMKAYRNGRRRITARVARIFIDVIRSRIETGLAIIAELEAIERTAYDHRRNPAGWRVVRERDGVVRDGRGSFKRRGEG